MLGFEIFMPKVDTTVSCREVPSWGGNSYLGEVVAPTTSHYYDEEREEVVEYLTAYHHQARGGWEYFMTKVWSDE